MTWLLRVLAIVFAVGAVIAGFIGYRLSDQPPPPPPAPVAAVTYPVVESLKPLRAGEAIAADGLGVKQVAARPAGSFSDPAQVVGQAPKADIAAGETLNRSHFAVTGQLQRGLRPGERAVAIKVDEVVGLGGFAQPGDRVDVLLYLRPSQETRNASSGQVVLSGVRLLAVGEAVHLPAAPDEGDAAAPARSGDKAGAKARTTTSAVLAVPEAAAPRLMLAANSGSLRLSLRPAEGAAKGGDQAYLVRLDELAQAAPPVSDKPAAARRKAPPAVVIHAGDSVRTTAAPQR